VTFQNSDEEMLWMRVAVAVAESSNSTRPYLMAQWADHAVEDFRKRRSRDGDTYRKGDGT